MADEENIRVLDWKDAIRRRPHMFIDDVGVMGLRHLARELFECPHEPTRLVVTMETEGMEADAIEITAAATPISTERCEPGRPIFLLDLCTRYGSHVDDPPTIASIEFLDDTVSPAIFRRSGEPPFILAIANALSKEFVLTSIRDGAGTAARFERGVLVAGPEKSPDEGENGVRIRFVADPEIFGNSSFRFEHLAVELCDFALRRRVDVELYDRDMKKSFVYAGRG